MSGGVYSPGLDWQALGSIADALGGTRPGPNYAGLNDETARLLDCLRSAMYPDVFGSRYGSVAIALATAHELLQQLLARVDLRGQTDAVAMALLRDLPRIRQVLQSDVLAAYEGDPAATCCEEVMLAYPAFDAISSYRIAHTLYQMNVPILPRVMTELAHRNTGIDIHPGADIGPSFFIDHGTGVVIGETTVIGHHVKLYQGVTLGAKSFDVAPDGTLVKGVKRHPNIGNNVVIYAGATILGGDTTIGDNCIIGGNVWLLSSVEPNTTVLAAPDRQTQRKNSAREG